MASVPARRDGLPRLVFIHVSKTGGTSLRRMLEETWHNGNSLQGWLRRHFNDRSDAEIAAASLIFGHYEIEQHRRISRILSDQVIYASIARQPLAQIVSYYNYVLRQPEGAVWRKEFLSMGLAQALRHEQISTWLCNPSSKLLKDFFFGRAYPLNDYFITGAIRRLTVLGTTELFGASYLLICWFTGRSPTHQLVSLNMDPRRSRPDSQPLPHDEEVAELIKHTAVHDQRLCKIADRRTREQTRAMLEALGLPSIDPRSLSEPETYGLAASALLKWQESNAVPIWSDLSPNWQD